MLKFQQVRLKNFLVYEDATITFATDGRTTVIRAENGSGKTTLLRALEWAVYGDDALPNGSKYRVHPPSHGMPDDGPIDVSVELDVALEDDDGEGIATIRRSVTVEPAPDTSTGWKRRPANAEFAWHDGKKGDEDELETRLPWRLREFFFTDGDKATDYVGGLSDDEIVSSTSKRNSDSSLRGNVTDAIRSLLGLDLLDAVKDKATTVARELDKALADSSGDEALAEARVAADEARQLVDRLKTSVEELTSERQRIRDSIERLQEKRDELLKNGDPTDLEQQIAQEEKRLSRATSNLTIRQREDASSLTAAGLTYSAGQKVFSDYTARAQPLVNSGVVPATYLWWVRRRLDEGQCMCGCVLDPSGDTDAQERHQHVQELVDRSTEESRVANHAGDLYYHIHAQLEGLATSSWTDELRERRQAQRQLQEEIEDAERALASLVPRLENARSTEVGHLRQQIRDLEARDHELDKRLGALEVEIQEAAREATSADRLLSSARKQAHAAGDLSIKAALYQDVLDVLSNSISARTDEDVQRLSDRMNELFTAMIGGHEVIREVRVSRSPTSGFEVEGIGRDGQRMDVAHQFNGASKRALTNAFVVALGQTAGVNAPNVIDTPLGMMDLSVRRRVFEIMAAECPQLVMLLTRSEIVGIEEALDGAFVQTVTNLGSGDAISEEVGTQSVVCSCTHRQYCGVCERRDDGTSSALERRAS